MNKELRDFAEKYNFSIHNNAYVATFNGYHCNLTVDRSSSSPLYTKIYYHTEDASEIAAIFPDFKSKYGVTAFNITKNFLEFRINALTISRCVKNLEAMLFSLTALLNEKGFLGEEYCCMCGKKFDDDKTNIETSTGYFSVHAECKINLLNEQNKMLDEFNAKPNNYLKGTLGAILGAAIGGVLLVVIYLLGYYASLSGIVAVVCASLLYNKFGGKTTWMKLLITLVTSFIVLFVFYNIALLISIQIEIMNSGLNGIIGVFEFFELFLTEAPGEYFAEVFGVLAFGAIGAVYSLFDVVREVKNFAKPNI